MSAPLSALKEIRDKHYLSPEDFTKALRNDRDIFKEEERFYLEKLAQKEHQIIEEVGDWAVVWGQSPMISSDIPEISQLLIEILGPLTPQAKQEILVHIRQSLSSEWVQSLPPSLKAEISGFPIQASDKWLRILPWSLMVLGLLFLTLSQYGGATVLLPLGGSVLLAGAVWLYLRS